MDDGGKLLSMFYERSRQLPKHRANSSKCARTLIFLVVFNLTDTWKETVALHVPIYVLHPYLLHNYTRTQYTVCTILYGVRHKEIALCTHPLLLDVLRTGVSFKKTTNTKQQVALLHRHNIVMDNTPWWITALAPSRPPILAQHQLARHLHWRWHIHWHSTITNSW